MISQTEKVNGNMTWMLCVGAIFFGFWCGCCLIPFCVNGAKDTQHKCPNCKSEIGVQKAFWSCHIVYNSLCKKCGFDIIHSLCGEIKWGWARLWFRQCGVFRKQNKYIQCGSKPISYKCYNFVLCGTDLGLVIKGARWPPTQSALLPQCNKPPNS